MPGNFSASFILNFRKFCDSCHISQHFLQGIIDVFTYCLNISGKQFRKLQQFGLCDARSMGESQSSRVWNLLMFVHQL